MRPFIRSPYNYDRREAGRRSAVVFDAEKEPSKTVQSQAEEADINVIVKRFGLTGQLPENVRVPTFGDFTGVFDYQSAMNMLISAEQSFMAMPAEVRFRFQNDPQKFVEFCSDDKNIEEMRKMGLAVPAPIVDNTPVSGKSENGNGDGSKAGDGSGAAKESKDSGSASGKS